jgi:transcriptional accessory protein Tex/SPT6
MSEAVKQEERLNVRNLKPKMKLEGQVTNIELFGAFVDVGAEADGLVHISQISENTVNRVADALSPGDEITVWVRKVDAENGRIDLTMIEPPERTIEDLHTDQVTKGKVTKLAAYGAFVDIGVERDGLIHISEMSDGFVGKPSDVMNVGDEIEVRVVKVDRQRRRIELSLLDLPGAEQDDEPEEEDAEETLTAMELAWQDAMERQGTSIKVPVRKQGKRRRKSDIRREQASIIARTLQSKKS